MDQSTTEPKRLRLGVVGLGRAGKIHALNALRFVQRVQLVSVCSPVDSELQWARDHLGPYGVNACQSFDQLLEEPGLEAILIASTTKVHHQQVVAGIQKKLHVLCEKPLAVSIEQSREILQLSRQAEYSHLKIMTAFCRRFDASYQNAVEAISEGRIGTPVVVRCDNRDRFDRSEAMMNYLTTCPGIFIDSGSHDIDLTLSFLGSDMQPKSCHAIGTISLFPELAHIGDVDNAIGTVEWYPRKEGDIAPISYHYLSRIMAHGFDNPTEIIGTKGALKINLNPRQDHVVLADEGGIGNEAPNDFYGRYKESFVTELETFADCILDQQPLPYELSTTIKGMEIAVALQQSLRTGKKIQWDKEGNRINV